MNNQEKSWQALIDVIFNNIKDVPIKIVVDFRKFASLHKLEYYCDFIRGKKLPSTLLEEPWEWKYLDDLSRVLPQGIQILVLKGACVRDMDLYPLPMLRESADLDIFVYGCNDYKNQKDFIDYLVSKNRIKLTGDWIVRLRKLKNVIALFENNYIDIHFDLFSPLGNLSNIGFNVKKKNKYLEEKVIQQALPYRRLMNIKKMSNEDFWLYNIFHFLKDFPTSTLPLILDSYLLLESKKTTLKQLKKHANITGQQFLYNIGVYILDQLLINKEHEDEREKTKNKRLEINWLQRKVFKIERIKDVNKYSIKCRLLDSFSKGSIIANGKLFFSLSYTVLYLIISNLFVSTIDESSFNRHSISNLITKVLYTFTRFKNLLKMLCLKAAGNRNSYSLNECIVIPTEKKLISVKLQDLKLTFNIPIEFYKDLKSIWEGFLSDEHLNKSINVEKIQSDKNKTQTINLVYSNNNVHLNLFNKSNGVASLSSSGEFFAESFWDVRTFALYLFRAMTLTSKDLLLVHAGAVNFKDQTLIFPAGSSAGKTTFFNLMIKNDFLGINDDTVLLKKEGNIWSAYPTPFMSRNQNSLAICEKTSFTGIIDLIKVSGGHEIKPLEMGSCLAILMNNSMSDFVIDDGGDIQTKTTSKLFELSKQLKYSFQVKFSLEFFESFIEILNHYIVNPNQTYTKGNNLVRLIELRGDSMEPAFKNGSILPIEEIAAEKIRPKDIICFKNSLNELPIIHRVKYLIKHTDEITIITKGDKSIFHDSPNIFKSDQTVLRILDMVN